MTNKFYKLKVTLKGITPPIYREFSVPANISLEILHYVIQSVMGWEDEHLYAFNKDKVNYMDPLSVDEIGGRSVSDHTLDEFLKRKNSKMLYKYDFGDNWQHEILLLDSNFTQPSDLSYICLSGKRACPPEDVGGAYEYAYFCEVISNPEHKDYARYKDWMGDEILDPEFFDLEEANKRLKELNEKN